ncbi:MAG: mechanosensitive ion channel domain-containing protein, partial [Thermoanaerobaculia bacterium]
SNNMVHVGDWVEMPRYGADGDVIDVALHTVKVQNWDKTITTIPTYRLISDAFKNWRGMSESGGRRIKRSVLLDLQSIRFVDEKMLESLQKIQYIQEYLERKLEETRRWNEDQGADLSSMVNGRNLTNVGTFRAYVESYLRNHPMIRQDMTFLVRQLPPLEKGLPLEIYVFSREQRWVQYEGIQADIFDHILAVMPDFGLRVVQIPTGADLRAMSASLPSARP